MSPVKNFTVISMLVLSACSSTEQTQQKLSVDEDPRIGEEVKSVCSTRFIKGWQHVDNDKNALILNMPRNQSYKVSLIGTCDADWALSKIAIVSRTGSSCLYQGDKVFTDSNMNIPSSCTVNKIELWHPEKLAPLKSDENKP